MVIDWDEIVALRRPVGGSGLYLNRGTEKRDRPTLPDIDVSVLPEIILLCDFLKDATLVFEERSDGIYAVLRGTALP